MRYFTISALSGDCTKAFTIKVEASSPSEALQMVWDMLKNPIEYRFSVA